MRQYILFPIFFVFQVSLKAQTEQEWNVCRDSVYIFVRKAAMVTAGDQSIAATLYDVYLTALKYNKIQEGKDFVDKNAEVINAKKMCDSLLNVMEKTYDRIPNIYVLNEVLCNKINQLRASVIMFHDVVFNLYFTDVYAKEVDTRYTDIQKQMDELVAGYSDFFKEPE